MKPSPPSAPDLVAALDLLHRHSGMDTSRFALPENRYHHSLPARLQEIRSAAQAGSAACLHWLEEHGALIRVVENRRKAAHDEAMRAPLK